MGGGREREREGEGGGRVATLAFYISFRHDAQSPVHVELAPRRREAVTISGRGRGAAEGGGEVCPGPGGRIVHVEVVEFACAGRAGDAMLLRRSHAGWAARLRTHAWLAAAACAAAEHPAPSRRLKQPLMVCALHASRRAPKRLEQMQAHTNTHTHTYKHTNS